MSTLPGLASKGEKGKSKYQSLDINSLYRVSLGESLEKQQQKSTLPLKHGMQSLGRVPSARRPPANLPSIKSEHSGTDPAVSLVPSGGPGWGKQETTTSSVTSSPSSTSTVTNSSVTSPAPASTQISAHQAAIALPVTTTIPPPVKHNTPSVTPATTDKSWSSVMTGSDLIHPPPYQSPQFQHEFPSLSAGDGGPPRTGTDTQYGPGPSLRPQTEGSWMQGGSRANLEIPPRSSSAPLGAPPQLSAQVGLTHQSLPPQYHGILPQFMYRGNFASNGHGSPNISNMPPPMSNNGRNRVENRQPPARSDNEEVARRPIIKEEDLSRMDDMTKDMGWAAQDDIDYNQKLAFSDDESATELHARKPDRQISLNEQDKTENYSQESDQSKNWGRAGNMATPINKARSTDEDEVLAQKRRQQHQVLLTAAEKAKQRKEEEEKRYLESKQAAGKKLQDLLNKGKRDKDQDELLGTISPSVVPPQPITPAPIPVPDWDKDRDSRSRSEVQDDKTPAKSHRDAASDFRQLTQIEGRNFVRKDSRNAERERDRDGRERNGPSFSRQLPPRLQKKQQLRNNSSPQPPMSYGQHQYDQRWTQNNQSVNKTSPTSSTRKARSEWDGSEKEHDDEHMRYHSNDEVYRGPNRMYSDSGRKSSSDNRHEDDGRDFRNQNFDYKKEKHDDNWERSRDKYNAKGGIFDEHTITRQNSDEWHGDRHDKYHREDKTQERYERPQRPDSRDSRTSRESRHSRDSMRDSEPRDHISSWADSITYEEKKKDHQREDRRQVPGPITKEKIEADEKHNEKRNLTQLKRGSIPEKKLENTDDKILEKEYDTWNNRKKDSSSLDNNAPRAWADDVIPATASPDNSKFTELLDKSNKGAANLEPIKQETKVEEMEAKRLENIEANRDREDKRSHNINRNRSTESQSSRSQGWDRSGGVVYRSWFKKGRGSRSGGSQRSSTKSGDWHGTDSDASVDEISVSTESGKDDRMARNSQKSPKPLRKTDDKSKDIKNDKFSNERKNDRYQDVNKREYEPRGEPSRHGRGGGNIRSRGGLSKRIDGYGPPPSKSPFGHVDEKDKKHSNEEMSIDVISSDERSKNTQGNAGVIGSARKDMPLIQGRIEKKHEDRFDRNKPRKISDNRKMKPRSKDDNCDTSDHSDDSGNRFNRKSSNKSPLRNRNQTMNSSRRNNPPPRLSGDKRSGNFNQMRNEPLNVRQNSSNSLRTVQAGFKKDGPKEEKQVETNLLGAAAADISLKTKEHGEDIENLDGELEDKNSIQGDSDGFQEVKSKKTVKERQKSIEDKPLPKPISKIEVPAKPERKGKTPTSQLSQQQIANIPSLMDTPINPPAVIPQPTNKNQYDRPRQKLPPRLAKQRENSRLQKAQMQHGMCDISDLNKVNPNMNMYTLKDGPSQIPMVNAWEKPLSTQLRGSIDQDSVLSIGIENCKSLEQPQSPGQNASPNNDKVIVKNIQLQDKSGLDGSNPPVNTIIFENTNYKLSPGMRNNRNDKPRGGKLEDGPTSIDNTVMSGFNKPITDLLNKSDKQSDIQIQLAFNKEDSADMKLDFFDSDLSHLTDDKSSKNLALPRSIHAMTSSNSTNSPSTADLNFKIASVKKVWESSMPPVIEHNVGQDDANSSFASSFGPDPNSLDPSVAFTKSADAPDDGHEGYSPSSNQNASNSTTNVCKVKPTQQVPGTTGQTITGTHQQHSAMISSGLMGPLSPPPIQPVLGPTVGLNQAPQQFTTNQHLGYQASLGGNTQYGMSAIPSPPTVLFNSTQQIQPQAGLYGGFPIDQLGGQRGSQYSQYSNPYNLGQTASSPYSQSLYLQTAQPHPPPTAQAPPDLYQNISNYRMTATGPFGQNQQLNNPTTVLISSTSNSLMSATVKPSNQQISAIGTKTGAVGQTYQQQSQQGQQLYMTYDPMQQNYLTNTGVMPRGPSGPVQNNVVPALQPSSSYYSGSTGGQTGYYQTPGNSTLQSGPLQQHQAGYGLQGNVFGTHNQSHTNAGLQLSSHFLSQMQLAALNVPPFRSQNLQNTSYMKGMGNQQIGDQNSRSQQLKSPGTQQEVLSSVFNSGPQIPSPKSRQNCKQPPPQPSPTTQHKYNLYQSVGNQPPSQRYPTPIQRPPSGYQPSLSSVQNNGANNQKHRANSNINKGPTRQYYSPQGGGLSSQSEKSDDSKLGDGGTSNATNSTNSNSANIVNKVTIGNVAASVVNQTAEMGKDLNKDDSSVMKD